MNVFWLDDDLHAAAQAHPTRYTKIILESGQCLCSALHNNGLGNVSPYGPGYNHHPISRWAGESADNWFWLVEYMSALHNHYYGYTYADILDMGDDAAWDLWEDREVHKTIVQIATAHVDTIVDEALPHLGRTARPKCVLDFCVEDSVVETYRKYIVCVKSHLDWFEWSAEKPSWYDDIVDRYPHAYRYGKSVART